MNAPVDMGQFIEPKSNQLNADDLIAGPRTIVITKVSANPSGPEQPVAIHYEGDNGKPYYPCKSMRRVMVHVWGADASQYVGRAMTIYRDAEVAFGGMKVGGIRISHMTNIDGQVTMALTSTRANKKPFTVKPLKADAAPKAERQVAATDATPNEAAFEQLYALKAKVAEAADRATALAIYESAPEEGWTSAMYDELKTAVGARLSELKKKPALEAAQ